MLLSGERGVAVLRPGVDNTPGRLHNAEVAEGRRPALTYGVLGASLVCHAALVISHPISAGASLATDEARITFFLLVGMSVVVSVTKFAVPTDLAFRVTLGIHVIPTFFLLASLADTVGAGLPLLLVFIAEACVYERYPASLAIGVAASLLAAAVRAVALSFRVSPWSALAIADMSLVVTPGVVCAVAGALLSRYREKVIELQRDSRRLETALTTVTQASLSYQRYAEAAEERSAKEERLRITRDIHDIVGYTLTNNIILMEAATDVFARDPPRARALVDMARENAEEGLGKIREALYVLRAQEVPGPIGLQSLAKMVKLFEMASGVKVRASYGESPQSFGDAIDSAVHHIIQEGLINSFRHGKASAIDVHLWCSNEQLRVSVRDNGLGVAEHLGDGIGIAGMKERARKLGGELTAGNVTNGFLVVATIPLEPGTSPEGPPRG